MAQIDKVVKFQSSNSEQFAKPLRDIEYMTVPQYGPGIIGLVGTKDPVEVSSFTTRSIYAEFGRAGVKLEPANDRDVNPRLMNPLASSTEGTATVAGTALRPVTGRVGVAGARPQAS